MFTDETGRCLTSGEFVFQTNTGKEIFTIEEIIGIGGSMVAYKVRHSTVLKTVDGVTVKEYPNPEILKEYCPQFLVDGGGFVRDGVDIVLPPALPQEYRDIFDNEKDEICKTYDFVNKYLNNNAHLYNFHSKQYGFYDGYGTVYVNTEYERGKVFSEIRDIDLSSLLEITRLISYAVRNYHGNGYLHLDIKPQNFFVISGNDGKPALVRQFDYNSIIEIAEIKRAIIENDPGSINLPDPSVYTVPELDEGELLDTGVKTDIFEIGAMLYTCLCGDKKFRLPDGSKFRGFDSDDVVDLASSKLLQGVGEDLIDSLAIFFKKTSSVAPVLRYSDMSEVIDHLDNIIKLEEYDRNTRETAEILTNMTLVPPCGISEGTFINVTGASKATVSYLVSTKTLSRTGKMVSLSPGYAVDIVLKAQSYYELADHLEEACRLRDGKRRATPEHRELQLALHLKEQYADETPARRIRVRLILARLYIGMNNKAAAEKNLNEAKVIASVDELWDDPTVKALVPDIIMARGDVEYAFGSRSAAILRYRKAERYARDSEYGGKRTVIEAKIKAAECHIKEGNPAEAMREYDKARYFSQLNGMIDRTVTIAKAVIDLCTENGYTKEKITYENILGMANEEIGEAGTTADIAGRAELVFTAGEYFPDLEEYIAYLESNRAEWGEESDEYKRISKYEWACRIICGDYEKGNELRGDTLNFIKRSCGEDSEELAKQYVTAARLCSRMTRFAEAEDYAKKAIGICEKNVRISRVILYRARVELAGVYLRMGDYARADEFVSKTVYSKYNGTVMMTQRLFAMGEGLCELGYFAAAESLCTSLLDLNGLDPYVRTYALLILALVKKHGGYYAEAKKICTESVLPLAESMKDCPAKADWETLCSRILADILYREKKYSDAAELIDARISLCRGDEPYLCHLYRERGLYLGADGNIDAAKADFRECEKILEKNNFGTDSYVMLYNSIATVMIGAGDLCEAENRLRDIVKLKPSVESPVTYSDSLVCNSMGRLESLKGNMNRAGKYFSAAYRNFERVGATLTDECIASLYGLVPAYESKGYGDTARKTKELADLLQDQALELQKDL